jgi:hypothetical protein
MFRRRAAAESVRVLEEEMRRLRAEVAELKETPAAEPGDESPISRRHLLRSVGAAAAAGLGAAVTGEMLTASPAAAAQVVGTSANTDPAIRGTNTSTGVGVWGEITNIASENAGVYGVTNGLYLGAAVWGRNTGDGRAVFGEITNPSSASAAVWGESTGSASGAAVYGVASAGKGVIGRSTTNNGVEGEGHVGVFAKNSEAPSATPTGYALVADVSFPGNPHMRLVPRHGLPTGNRLAGEFFVDSTGNYWMTKVAGPAASSFMRVGFNALNPTRIVDTRAGAPPDPAGEHKLVHGEELLVAIVGVAGVIAGATAVTLNVTAVSPTGGGFISLYPADLTYSAASPPPFSNVNFGAGQTAANSATVKIAPTGPNAGKIKVFNYGGSTDVILDVAGFFS